MEEVYTSKNASRKVKIAATQMKCRGWNYKDNMNRAEELIREASKQGAQIILIQELFLGPYFCQKENPDYFELAINLEEELSEKPTHGVIKHFQKLAKDLNVVLPISFFEKLHNQRFNSIVVIDADGEILGTYRKSHIPEGPGYQEKYYFTPGNTGFRVFKTKYANIGIGICWDQWFPETARCLALQGAEILFFPTAIGSEPADPSYDSKDHWQIVMQGHAGANIMPLVASNRVGKEKIENSEITFYGSSFIANQFGAKVKEANRTDECVLVEEFDLEAISKLRVAWGVFRDRRTELYSPILSVGNHK